MRMRRVLTFVVVLAAAAIGVATIGGSGVAAVQQAGPGNQGNPPPGPPPGPGGRDAGGIGPMLAQLDLTTAQQEQFKALMDSQRDAEAQYQEQLKTIGDEMKTLVQADTFDEYAVRALATKEAAITVELRVIHARTESAIYQLLTADQKALLVKLSSRMPPRGR